MAHGQPIAALMAPAPPRRSHRVPWWNTHQLMTLQQYQRQALTNLQAGDLTAAVDIWGRALALPNLPHPRRTALMEQIIRALWTHALQAVDAGESRWSEARRVLETLVTLVPRPHPAVWAALGFLAHWAQDFGKALDCYRQSAAGGHEGPELRYAFQLAQLQQAVQEPEAKIDIPPVFPPEPEEAREVHQAWRRLAALQQALLHQDPAQALQSFPPAHTGLPPSWALEGAVLAAGAGGWLACLEYLQTVPPSELAPPPLAFYGLMIGAVLNVLNARLPLSPEHRVSLEHWLSQAHLPSDVHGDPLADSPDYRLLQDHLRDWQYRHLLEQIRRRLAQASGGEAHAPGGEEVYGWVEAAIRLKPHERLSQWMAVWLLCEEGRYQQAGYVLQQVSETPDLHPMRLAVWLAHRAGEGQRATRRLHELLIRYPGDVWALARWRDWMLRLGRAALERGEYRQALLHFSSLLLYLPDDPDGWRGCAEVNEALNNPERAADCRAESQRCSRLPAVKQVQRELARTETSWWLLEQLVATGLTRPTPPGDQPAVTFSPRLLDQLLRLLLRRTDPYLTRLLRRWRRERTPEALTLHGEERTHGEFARRRFSSPFSLPGPQDLPANE